MQMLKSRYFRPMSVFCLNGFGSRKKMDHYLETKKMSWTHTFRSMRLQSRLIGIMLQPGANFFWFRQALNLALFLIFHVGILHCVSVLPSAGQFFTENPAEHGIWKKRFGERM